MTCFQAILVVYLHKNRNDISSLMTRAMCESTFYRGGKVQNSFYGLRNDIKVACQLPTFSYIRMLASQNATLVVIEININRNIWENHIHVWIFEEIIDYSNSLNLNVNVIYLVMVLFIYLVMVQFFCSVF